MEERQRKLVPSTKNLVAHYKLWAGEASTDSIFDYSLSGFTGDVSGSGVSCSYPGLAFDGTGDYINIGAGPASVKTVAVWIKITSASADYTVVDLNGTDKLLVWSSILGYQGFAGGTVVLSVDGVAAATAVDTSWHLIGITDTVAKNASALTIGIAIGDVFSGSIGEVRLYSSVLSPVDMKNLYELTRWRYGV